MNITTLEQAGRHLMEVGVVDFETMTVDGKQLLEVCGFSTSNARAEIARQIERHGFNEGVDYMRSKGAAHQKSGQKPIIYSFTVPAAAIIYANATNKAITSHSERKETRFGDLLRSAFPLVEIDVQHAVGRYRIDFYMPEHDLAIEYDEAFHKSQQNADRDREDYIATIIHCDFIRVPEGEEGAAIIEIFKRINGL